MDSFARRFSQWASPPNLLRSTGPGTTLHGVPHGRHGARAALHGHRVVDDGRSRGPQPLFPMMTAPKTRV